MPTTEQVLNAHSGLTHEGLQWFEVYQRVTGDAELLATLEGERFGRVLDLRFSMLSPDQRQRLIILQQARQDQLDQLAEDVRQIQDDALDQWPGDHPDEP